MAGEISLDKICDALHCQFLHRGNKNSVKWVVASGLMSDVLTTEKEDILLVSNLTTSQVVRTADMVEASAILLTNGKPISEDTVRLAKELNITLLKTDFHQFEVCYQLGKFFYEGIGHE